MEWVKFKLPFPVFQQEEKESCIEFLTRIKGCLESPQIMLKEDATFWFLVGVREDIIPKIPFDPEKSLWIEPDVLEADLREIDAGRELKGPFRTSRFQNCFNYFVCFKCGNWGHKSLQCRNEKPANIIGRALKRKIMELCYADEEEPKPKPSKSKFDRSNKDHYSTSSSFVQSKPRNQPPNTDGKFSDSSSRFQNHQQQQQPYNNTNKHQQQYNNNSNTNQHQHNNSKTNKRPQYNNNSTTNKYPPYSNSNSNNHQHYNNNNKHNRQHADHSQNDSSSSSLQPFNNRVSNQSW